MKILFFGDVVGRLGRRAVAEILPKYKRKYKPDLIIANGENLAHGVGITLKTVAEMFLAGVDFLTTGNHVYKKLGYEEVFAKYGDKVIRPANYPEGRAGNGWAVLDVGREKIYIINLNGRVFIENGFEDPFAKFGELKKLLKIKENDIVIVDFHAEATSEKAAFGWYVDGKVTAMVGTHTHVPTADAKILTKGTAYVTDVGMVGAKDSVIGVAKEGPLEMFVDQVEKKNFERPEKGVAQVNAVLISINNKTGKAKKIERVDDEVKI